MHRAAKPAPMPCSPISSRLWLRRRPDSIRLTSSLKASLPSSRSSSMALPPSAAVPSAPLLPAVPGPDAGTEAGGKEQDEPRDGQQIVHPGHPVRRQETQHPHRRRKDAEVLYLNRDDEEQQHLH